MAAKAEADGLLEQKAAAAQELRAAEKGRARAARAAEKAAVQAAQLGVELRAAEGAAQAGAGAKGKQLQQKAAAAAREANEQRCGRRVGEVEHGWAGSLRYSPGPAGGCLVQSDGSVP